MDTTTVVIVALFAVIIIAAFLVFRQRAKVSIDRTGLKIDASNEPTPGVKAKGTVNARDEPDRGVDAKNIKASQDVNLVNTDSAAEYPKSPTPEPGSESLTPKGGEAGDIIIVGDKESLIQAQEQEHPKTQPEPKAQKHRRWPLQTSSIRMGRFGISLAYPKFLSKRFSSVFLVHIFLPEMRREVSDAIRRQFQDKQPAEQIQDSQLKFGQTVKIKVYSPDITVSEPVVKRLVDPFSAVRFIARPDDNCSPGSHECILSISDNKSDVEYESITFTVKVADYAFGHVSRPLLSRTTSVILGIGSFLMFLLALLGQIDQAFGLTAGTTAAAISATIFLRFFSQYQRPTGGSTP